MQTDSIFLIDADGDCEEIASRAAARSKRRLRWLGTTRDIFRGSHGGDGNAELIMVDLDPGSHGMALLEAISACAVRPPVIVLTALEEAYMAPIAREHGADACLGKPLTVEKTAAAIDRALTHRSLTSDAWGHETPRRPSGRHERDQAIQGIVRKLSPIMGRKKAGATATRPKREG